MPALVTPQGNVVHTIQEKAEALQPRFYPTVEADLSDIKETIFKDNSFSPNLIQISQEATKEDVESILRTTKAFRAPGIDGITNRFLQAMGSKLAEAVAMLATACWKIGYYPCLFKRVYTITLRKPGKPTYSNPGA
jgi:hypothetical protein